MTEVFFCFFEISVSMSVLVAALLLLSPLLGKRYAAKWKFLIWILFALRLVIPINGRSLQPVFTALRWTEPQTISQNVSGADSADAQAGSGSESAEIQAGPGSESAGALTASEEKLTGQQATLKPEPAEAPADGDRPAPPARVTIKLPAQMTTPIAKQSEKSSITLLDIVAYVWLAGCLMFLSLHIVTYLHYRKRIKRLGHVIEDAGILNRIAELKGELHITRKISAITCSEAGNPMILGFLRPILVLPDKSCRAEDLFFILKHELVHVKRGDVFYKLLFVAANAIHWFNPLIYLMQREAAVDMELSCDERVLQGTDYAMRKAYTETLLTVIHEQGSRKTALSSQFYGGKQVMKKRFKYILSKNGKKNGIVLVACAVLLSIGIGTLVGCSVAQEAADGNRLPLENNPPQTESTGQTEPTEPTEQTEPAEPTEQTEPTEPTTVVPDDTQAEEPARPEHMQSLGGNGAATLFFGDGYSMYILDEGCSHWSETMDGHPADVWSLESDENAQLRVVRLENIERVEAQDWVRAQFPKRIFLHHRGYDNPYQTGDIWAEDMTYYGYLYAYFFPEGTDIYVVIEDCKQTGIDTEAMRLNNISHGILRSMLSTFQPLSYETEGEVKRPKHTFY